MFSANHKISSRQLYRNYAAALISLGALLPPLVMNRDNPGSIVLALLFLGLYLWGAACVPRPSSGAVKWLCYVNYWVLGTMLARLTGLLVQSFLLTDTRLWVILLWFFLFCFYNMYKGLECRLRVSEVLFPFFLFLILFLSLLMFGEVEAGRLLRLRFSFGRRQWALGYELFCWLGAAQSLWHLRGRTGDQEHFHRTVRGIWLTGAAAVCGFAAFSHAIYGNAGHTGLVYPVASAMTLAHFPGNVIGRMDALFVFGWIIGFFLLCSSLFAPLMDEEPDRRRKGLLLVPVALAFGAACLPECVEWGQWLLYRILTPLQIVLLLFQWAKNRPGGRRAAAAGCAVLCLLLNGCSSQELEQLSLVTAVAVDPGEGGAWHLTFGFGSSGEEGEEPFETESMSIEGAKETYREYNQKNMDFNHLKNFYFSEEILQRDDFPGLLEEIQINAAYSRGTLLFVTEGPAGEEASKEQQPEEGMPVHQLLNAWYNRESCRISVITADGRYKGYVSWP
ncbi:MAG: GerAB/ArcD/ProY family transporter [Lachnospiraceae bacterium]